MMRNLDAEYDELIIEPEEVVHDIGSVDRDKHLRLVRLRIEDLRREQMGLPTRLQSTDRRHGPNALN